MAYSKQLRASSRNAGSCDTLPQGPNRASVTMVFRDQVLFSDQVLQLPNSPRRTADEIQRET